MSQLLHKILHKPLNGITIRAFLTNQNPSQSSIPHLFNQPQPQLPSTQNPLLESLSNDKTTLFNRFHIYPTFSFGYFLNPVSSSGSRSFKPEEGPNTAGSGSGSGMMWADSVKKKRKKKMNKHKLKKLKKRLRHCS